MSYHTYPAKDFRKYLPASYKKKTVSVILTDHVTLSDLNWSGGTRSEYTVLDAATGHEVSNTGKYAQIHPWDNPAEGKTLPLPDGAVVVRTGFFCGKVSQASIYMKSLPQIIQPLSPEDKEVRRLSIPGEH